MDGGDRPIEPRGPCDARSAALAKYLRERAASFSMSADFSDLPTTAEAGMALLDAAALAADMSGADSRIIVLSEAGLFESMPEGTAAFLETPEIRAAIQRPLISEPLSGEVILAELVAAAIQLREPPPSDRRA